MFFAPRFSATRVLASSLLFALVTAQAFAADPPKSDDEKAFYAIGTSMARQLESLKPISAREMDLLIDGMKDVVNGEPLAVEQQEGANFVRTLVTARQKVASASPPVSPCDSPSPASRASL